MPTYPACAILKSVEHPCHQCHSAVPDTSPFCPNCGAPQIRFAARELSSIAILVSAGVPQSTVAVEIPRSIEDAKPANDRRAASRAVMNAGTVAGVLSLVPGLAVLALPLAGFICVLLYRRANISGELTPSAGFRLGAKAGIIAALILGVVKTLSLLAENGLRTAAIENVQRVSSFYTEQHVKETVEFLKTPGGLAVFLIVNAVVVSVLFIILCGAGGAVSAAILRRKFPPH